MSRRHPLVTCMVRAAMKAARSLLRDFGEVEHLQVSKKGPADFVSHADRAAERILQEELGRMRPHFAFLLEEGGERPPPAGGNARGRWIVDPLDGTTNFLHAVPHFAISIAAEEKGRVQAAVVYDPVRDELFWAQRGGGAFLNDQRLRVSARQKLDQALIATGIPFAGHGEHERFLAELGVIMPRVAGIRRFGSAALDLAYVAAGRYDAFWEHGLNLWDIAAGALIVQEAGGLVSDHEGLPRAFETGEILASNGHLHRPMLRLLRQAHRQAATEKGSAQPQAGEGEHARP